jgi:CheY-like chemotaxis protein
MVVEDEYFIALDMAQALEEYGAEVVGPAGSIAEALELLEHAGPLDGAIVDVNLHGDLALPVAEALRNRRVPFVFTTGYDARVIPERFHNIARCEKPVDFNDVARALFANGAR